MTIENKILSYLQEGEIYQGQALFDEARRRYTQAVKLIKTSPALKNQKRLMEIVSKKMNSLNYAYAMFQRIEASGKMSEKEKDHILKQLLPPGQTSTGRAELEWAGALLSFGEFEMALNEFNKLLIRDPTLRVTAAKNILKCHTKISSFDMAKTQLEMWSSGDLFTPAQLKRVKAYLENSIDPAKKEEYIPLSDVVKETQEDPAPTTKKLPPKKRPLTRMGADPDEKDLRETQPPDDTAVLPVEIPDDAVVEVFGEETGRHEIDALPPETEITVDNGPYHFLSMSIPLTNSVNEIGLEVDSQKGDKIRRKKFRGTIPRFPGMF